MHRRQLGVDLVHCRFALVHATQARRPNLIDLLAEMQSAFCIVEGGSLEGTIPIVSSS
jgi:hypothetical protein